MKRKTPRLPALTAGGKDHSNPGATTGPKLKASLPQAIQNALQRLGVAGDDVVISIFSDINLLGQYASQWFVATRKGMWVFDEKTAEEPLLSVTFAESSEFRTVAVVGSGILQARVGEIWLDLLRYSNRKKYYFGRVAKRLEQLRNNEAFELNAEDENDPRRCGSCGLMLEFPGEVCPRCINRGAAVHRVLQLMRPYWGAAAMMMMLLVLSTTISMTTPRLTMYLVDNVLIEPAKSAVSAPHKEAVQSFVVTFMSFYTKKQRLLMVVGALAGFAMCGATISILNGRLVSRVGTAITFDVRGRLVSHLEQLSLSYYDKQSVGSLVGRVAYDTEAVQGFMSQLTGGFLAQILYVVIAAFFMFSIEPKLAMWALLPAPFVILATFFYYRWVYPRYDRLWDRSSKQAGMLSGLLSGIRVVKAFAQEDREFERFQKSSRTLRDTRRQLDASVTTYSPIFGLVFSAGGWIVWYVGGGEVLAHNLGLEKNLDPAGGITLGTLMGFFGYMGMFYAPLQSLTNLTTWLTSFSTQMHRIFEVLDTPISIADRPDASRLPLIRGEIEFQNVVFGYSRQTPILKNVSFKIEAGQSIGVVGRSGSGKTTIINLISRFYDIDDGRIFIDGVDIREINKADLTRQVGVVLQEPFLFRGTLWQNLTYGKTDARAEDVIAASRAGNSHDFIMRQPQAYDQWVGERGAGLSGGERQRLSIARALLCDPRVLILDEATSSVDSESELAIQNALQELIRGRTSIIIAHRLSTLRNCDKIFVIEEGRLVEQGTHPDLMKLDGKYAKLVKIQTSVTKSDTIDTITAHEEEQKRLAGAMKKIEEEYKADPVTGLMPITHHGPRWLTPAVAKIHLGNRGALHVTILNERIYNGVFAIRCMPIRHPSEYLSLRWFNADNREQEIGLIRDLSQWPAEVQKLINESLLRRYFVHTIASVDSIEVLQNYLNMAVHTDLGKMEFFMRWSYDTAQDYGDHGKVLQDVEDNRYVIPDVTQLPQSSRELFERYIYW